MKISPDIPSLLTLACESALLGICETERVTVLPGSGYHMVSRELPYRIFAFGQDQRGPGHDVAVIDKHGVVIGADADLVAGTAFAGVNQRRAGLVAGIALRKGHCQ